MTVCYNNQTQRYEYCSLHLSTYIAVGVLVPLGIVLIIALVYLYLKCRQRQIRNQQRQTYMSTGIPMYNNEREHPIPYTFSYPPHYSALAEESFDKLPSYEQSVQGVSEDDNVNIINNGPATIPISISTEGISGANKTQT